MGYHTGVYARHVLVRPHKDVNVLLQKSFEVVLCIFMEFSTYSGGFGRVLYRGIPAVHTAVCGASDQATVQLAASENFVGSCMVAHIVPPTMLQLELSWAQLRQVLQDRAN